MIIASHPHSDHIGSLSTVIDEFGVDRLLMPEISDEMSPVSSSYYNLIESATDCSSEIINVKSGDEFIIDENCKIEIKAPLKDYDDYNNYSIVCKFVYGDTSFLFTGDIEELAERDIYDSGIDISSDVIKVAHHGSNTSSLKVFMQAASPDYAVIEVGSGNDYGHPHSETLKLLKLLDIKVYRTDLDGDVVIVSDGTGLKVITEK